MVTPRITNKLRGSLGEIYYKEFCDQRGWAYTSLENIYQSIRCDVGADHELKQRKELLLI